MCDDVEGDRGGEYNGSARHGVCVRTNTMSGLVYQSDTYLNDIAGALEKTTPGKYKLRTQNPTSVVSNRKLRHHAGTTCKIRGSRSHK